MMQNIDTETRGVLKRLPRYTSDDIFYVVIYSWASIWAFAFLSFTPESLAGVLDRVFTIGWLALALFGSLMASLGVLLRNHKFLELIGIFVTMTAPLTYTLIQFTLAAQGDQDRIALVFYAFWPVLFFAKRAVLIVNRVRMRLRESSDQEARAKRYGGAL